MISYAGSLFRSLSLSLSRSLAVVPSPTFSLRKGTQWLARKSRGIYGLQTGIFCRMLKTHKHTDTDTGISLSLSPRQQELGHWKDVTRHALDPRRVKRLISWNKLEGLTRKNMLLNYFAFDASRSLSLSLSIFLSPGLSLSPSLPPSLVLCLSVSLSLSLFLGSL